MRWARVENNPAASLLLKLFCLLSFYFCLTVSGAAQDESISVELPPGGGVRVENRSGGISIDVWSEKYVSVAAKVYGPALNRSPILVERSDGALKIGVLGGAATPPSRVDLTLRIPERSRLEIHTTGGVITVRGLPATLTARTVSGNIRAELPVSGDADITAESLAEAITSTLTPVTLAPARMRSGEHLYQARIGAGGKTVNLYSERGRITLAPSAAPANETPTEMTRKAPALIGAPGGSAPGVGTPARPATGPQEIDEGDVIRVDTELVTLNLSVIDRGTNRGLAGLTQRDFKLYEDGAEQEIAHFDSSSAPFNLVLLIDLSGSTSEVVNLIRGAALRFVASARPADRIAVITFADNPIVVSRLTEDREALRQRINAIEKPRGSTKLYDSVAFAMDEVLRESKDSRRNAIVLMSDGLDSTLPNVTGEGSKLPYKELLSRVQEFDGVLYALWLNTEYEALSPLDVQPETFDLGHDRMKELGEAGGGMFYEVENLEHLAGAYERVVADLGTVYSLAYRPKNELRDGRWRAIRVAVARPNAVARGKRGYYAK